MCILLPSGLSFVLDLFLAVGQTSSLLPRAGWQALLPAHLELSSAACVGHLWAGVALLQPRPELALVSAGCPGCVCAAGRGGQCWALPARPLGHSGGHSPAAGFDRLFSSVLLQLVPRAQPSRMFLEALGRA